MFETKKDQVKDIDFIGLTGAGLQFKSSRVKVMFRFKDENQLQEKCNDVIEAVSQGFIKPGDPLNKFYIAFLEKKRLSEE